MSEYSELWLIYSREHNAFWRASREHNAFWRASRSGYTYDIDTAGRYSYQEALDLSRCRDPQRDGSPSEIAVMAPEAAQAIERLERQERYLTEINERLSAGLETTEQQLAEMLVSLDRARQPSEAANIIERAAKVLTEAEARGDDTKGALAHQLADARAEIEQHNGLLRECQAFLFDDSGTPISPEDLRERVREALATPAPGKDSEGKD